MLSPDEILKVAKFQDVRTERNKRLLLCLLPSADDVQTSLGAGSRCKGTIKFADVQIYLHKKATYVQKHKWQGEFEEFMRILFIHSLPDIFVSHPLMVVANDTY